MRQCRLNLVGIGQLGWESLVGQAKLATAGADSTHFNCAFWTKLGYLSKSNTPATAWANNVVIFLGKDAGSKYAALALEARNLVPKP